MKIEVRLFASLVRYLPEGGGGHSNTLEIPDGITLGQVVKLLRIPEEMPAIHLINGRDAGFDQAVKDGDVVSLFPPLAGGCL